ncbi:MAG: hypothetical protein WCX86_08405, partial [Candidatus Hydrogenedentales bacterium]
SCKMVVGHYGLLRVFQQNYCTEDLCDVLFFCTGCISTLNPPCLQAAPETQLGAAFLLMHRCTS